MQRFNTVLAVALGAMLATACPSAFSADGYAPPGGAYSFPANDSDLMPHASPNPGAQQNPGVTPYGVVAGPPTQPGQSVRPASWPGAADPATTAAAAYSGPPFYGAMQPPYPNPNPTPAPAYDLRLVEEAQILGRVGTDIVTVHDVLTGIDELIGRNRDKIPADQVATQRVALVQEVTAGLHQLMDHINDPEAGSYVDPPRRSIILTLLHQQIETKMINQDFRQKVPKDNLPNIEEALARQFDQIELKELYKRENAQNSQELEVKLRAKGSSIDAEKRIFYEKVVAQQWVHEQVKPDDEITHDQMLQWYQAHLTDFDKPSRSRWEEVMVLFSRHASHEEAYAATAALGNQILSGVPLDQVAKARSDGISATKGGVHDWTTKGSLVCEELDRALFSLPVGQLSPIIESRTGYHIVRVVQRENASRTPFSDAQKEVKEKIRRERTAKAYKEFVTRLQKDFPAWTVFDDTSRLARRPRAEEPSRY